MVLLGTCQKNTRYQKTIQNKIASTVIDNVFRLVTKMMIRMLNIMTVDSAEVRILNP